MSTILRLYMDYRAKILQAVQREREEKRQEEISAERNKQKAENERLFLDTFKMKSLGWKSWADVPVYAYGILSEEIPKDGPLWVACKNSVCNEFISAVSSGLVKNDPLVGNKDACNLLVRKMKIDADFFPPELQPRAVLRYQKTAVYNYYISQ